MKIFLKKRIMKMYTVVCAGMLLLTGCAGTEQNVNSANTISESEDKVIISEGLDSVILNDSQEDAGTGDLDTTDTFEDANEMMEAADLIGIVSKLSESGCEINTSSFADGTSSSEGSGIINIVYSDEIVFQKGIVKSDGSNYSLESNEKDGLKDSDFVLCFGKQQADGSYLADRIIVIEFF